MDSDKWEEIVILTEIEILVLIEKMKKYFGIICFFLDT
jgi:hypothetical protein